MDLLKLHKELFLTLDIFVNKIPFLFTLSRKIYFTAVNHIANRTVPQIFETFKEIYQYYFHRVFSIQTMHSIEEFAPLTDLIASLQGVPVINLASANKHVPKIERKIRVVKERFRAARHGLPFHRIPKLLTVHIVFQAVKVLNFFPTKGVNSDTLSPKTIMSGDILNYKRHFSIQIGRYCQVHDEDAPCNSQNPGTKSVISLGPSENLQGGFKFMVLNTGKKFVRRSWDFSQCQTQLSRGLTLLAVTNQSNLFLQIDA